MERISANTHNPTNCHPERSGAESKDLRTNHLLSMTKLRRSFDALRLLRMTMLGFLRIRPTSFLPSDFPAERS